MKKFAKKLNIKNANSFKLEYYEVGSELITKIFKTYKAMEQYHNRQKYFMYLDCNRYAMINEKYHRFIKLPSNIVFEQNVEFIVQNFTEIIEAKNLQKFQIEE